MRSSPAESAPGLLTATGLALLVVIDARLPFPPFAIAIHHIPRFRGDEGAQMEEALRSLLHFVQSNI